MIGRLAEEEKRKRVPEKSTTAEPDAKKKKEDEARVRSCLHLTLIHSGEDQELTIRVVDTELFTKEELQELKGLRTSPMSMYGAGLSPRLAGILQTIAGDDPGEEAHVPTKIFKFVTSIDRTTHLPPPGWAVCGYYVFYAYE